MIKAIRRAYRFLTCDHINKTQILSFQDTTELRFCTWCGRVLSCTDDGSRRHNPHLLVDQLDRV